ncbi:hypothetical protein AGLY_002317 [Aphis glycines]|uniref:Uncharacterized protein n=1 Tax=Aphis glycines TaxID=307491 RepID=A0A6G0U3I4_APHGL|nr:hypothetical protein AGLY_002317 [Aphis glycines]
MIKHFFTTKNHFKVLIPLDDIVHVPRTPKKNHPTLDNCNKNISVSLRLEKKVDKRRDFDENFWVNNFIVSIALQSVIDVPLCNISCHLVHDDDDDDDDDDNNDGHHFDVIDFDEEEDEVPTDDYDDIDPAILEAQVNLVLQNLEANKKLAMKKLNEEPFEEKCVAPVITASEHFQKEICQKDTLDPTFGDGFVIDKIMNPKLRDDDVFLFEVQWQHENFAGIDVVEAPIIYDHWPDVALKFFRERYPEGIDKKKEKTD